eukprot:4170290-Prorocentrum_lima.AAC.1
MTSSLVGSEMCIRDSLMHFTGFHLCYLTAEISISIPTRTTISPGGKYPVSYTHLTLPTICSV